MSLNPDKDREAREAEFRAKGMVPGKHGGWIHKGGVPGNKANTGMTKAVKKLIAEKAVPIVQTQIDIATMTLDGAVPREATSASKLLLVDIMGLGKEVQVSQEHVEGIAMVLAKYVTDPNMIEAAVSEIIELFVGDDDV